MHARICYFEIDSVVSAVSGDSHFYSAMQFSIAIKVIALTGLFFTGLPMGSSEAQDTARLTGVKGIIGMPDARFDPDGTLRANLSVGENVSHASIGIQIAAPLYINFRQSTLAGEFDFDPADGQLHYGVDFKSRILRESFWRPAVAFGMDSALGDPFFSSEYISLSKTMGPTDLTVGLGWGRLGAAGHFDNPLGWLSDHFDQQRDFGDRDISGPEHWFKGEKVALFGGVSVRTPVPNLKLKAEYNSDDTALSGSDPGHRFNFGVDYAPAPWLQLGMDWRGGETLAVRLNLTGRAAHLKSGYHYKSPPSPLPRNDRDAPANQDSGRGRNKARALGLIIEPGPERPGAESAALGLRADHNPAQQVLRAAHALSSYAGPLENKGAIYLQTGLLGFRGPEALISRSALRRHTGQDAAPDALWHETEIRPASGTPLNLSPPLSLVLQQDVSLSERDTGILHRTSLRAGKIQALKWGLAAGAELRLNLAENLDNLAPARLIRPEPVRSNIDDFASQPVALNRLFLGWTGTPARGLNIAGYAGHLEEMFGGFGGEAVYQPWQSRLFLSANMAYVWARDPYAPLALIADTGRFTGSAGFGYEVPDTRLTLEIQAGRFLGEDWGGTFRLTRHFDNGLQLTAGLTVSEDEEPGFRGRTRFRPSLRIAMPLSGMAFMPRGPQSRAALNIAPLGQDVGARLRSPLPVRDLTRSLGHRALYESWDHSLR